MRWRVLLLASAISFVAGALARHRLWPNPTEVVEIKERERERVVKHTTKERTEAPNGAVREIVVERVTADRKSHNETPRPVAPVPYRPDWSVGVQWRPKWDEQAYAPTAAALGRRLLGDLWLTGTYDWQQRELLIGVKIEF